MEKSEESTTFEKEKEEFRLGSSQKPCKQNEDEMKYSAERKLSKNLDICLL